MKRIALLLILFVTLASVIAWLTVYFSGPREPATVEPVSPTSVTSPLPTPSPSPKSVTLLFGGDVMLDRHIRENATTQGNYDFILSEFATLSAEVDAFVVNLEGPITDFPSRSIGSAVGSPNNFYFTFEPRVTDFLNTFNIRVVNLGNNHILNFGENGLQQTYNYLDAAGIQSFGFTGNTQRDSYLITTFGEISFGFVNYNQFIPGGLEAALADIGVVRPLVDVVIVQPHWGLEYETTANSVIQQQAYMFIDAGADLIIGAHPHVVQQTEVYKNKTIYYSLGNFIFDQYFDDEVRSGKIVHASFDPVTLEPSFREFATRLERNGQTKLLGEIE